MLLKLSSTLPFVGSLSVPLLVVSPSLIMSVCLSLWVCRGVSSAWPWFTQGVVKSSQSLCLPNDCGWENTDLHGRKQTDLDIHHRGPRLEWERHMDVWTSYVCVCLQCATERDSREFFKVGLATHSCMQVCVGVFMNTHALKCVCKCVYVCVGMRMN